MKVLHVIEAVAFGGAESVVRAYATNRRPGAPEAHVAALVQAGGEAPFTMALRGAGAPITEVRCGRRRYRAEARALADTVAWIGADIVHTHVYHADFVGYWAARRSGVPVVATVHGLTGGDLKNRLYQWLDLRLLRRFAAVFCVSRVVRDRVLVAGCRPERAHYLPNAYAPRDTVPRDLARVRLGLAGSAPTIGWVGRLSREKGPDLFLDAVAALAAPRPRVVVIGDGPERRSVAERVARLDLGGTVRLVGEVPDAGTLLSAFDALVISSRTEGLPMVLLEAAGIGLPVVTFAVGGIPEALDESSAWLATPGDVGALAGAIGAAIRSPDESARRALRARAVIHERFGVEQWLDATARTYEEVLRG